MILNNLIKAKFLKRYKRFFIDCEIDGEVKIAHCPNTGSMKSIIEEAKYVYVEYNDDPKKKLRYKAHIIELNSGALVCINTMLPNKIVLNAIENKEIKEIENFDEIKPEVNYGDEKSKIDIWLKDKSKETFIEVKNTTLLEDNYVQFPDAITSRGAKHLRELSKEVEKGNRSVMFYLINRNDGDKFKVAEHIDKNYKEEYDNAVKTGVEVLAYKTKFNIKDNSIEIKIDKRIN